MATISGEWSGTIGTNNTTVDSWTVISDGEHTITWSVESARSYGHFAIIETSNGVTEGPQESLNVASVVTVTESLNAGDVVNFQARINVVGSSGSGSWEVTPPPPLPSNAVTPDQIDGVYVGAELVQALYHGPALLWRAIITVTPEPPTFLDSDPWITLPTVEGVSYSVDGTAGPGNTVTVTATAESGYELDGQTEWTHEWLPVVTITGTTSNQSRDQFRQACIDHGTTYDTVVELPFRLDTSSATSTLRLFQDCSSLISAPAMDTSQVTNMAYMFDGCSSLTSVPDLDTSQVTTMSFMFRDCSSLTSVPDLDTSQVTNMSYMFRDCSSLTDGNVRLIGKHPNVRTSYMIQGSGLTREPFYDSNGNPI